MGTIFIRTLIIYFVVLVALRLMGKREIGQLQPYELVVTMMIADLASVPMQDIGIPIFHGLIPIMALLVGQIVLSYLSIKSGWARRILCGQPTVLIQKGRIMEDRLRKQRYTVDGLMEELRANGYFSIEDIDYAILETSGQISVIPKPEKAPVEKQDINAPLTYVGFPRAIIMDGSYIQKNMEIMGLSKEKVDQYLKQQKVTYQNVFLLVYDESEKFYLQKKERKS